MSAQYRMERISRLLEELKYEVTRGMMEREIEETIGFHFLVPSRVFPSGAVHCRFETRPVLAFEAAGVGDAPPQLRLVEESEK